jgi:hypothetical protein
MPEPELRIELESDVMCGPLVTHMSGYTAEEFDRYVIERCSDPYRRAVFSENQDLVDFVRNAYAGTGAEIKKETVGVYEKVNPRGESIESLGKMGLSGPEFIELAKIAIAHGGIGVVAAPMLIKATKDVVVKWLDGRGRKSVKINFGPDKSIEITGHIDDKKIEKLSHFLQDAINSTAKPETPPKIP